MKFYKGVLCAAFCAVLAIGLSGTSPANEGGEEPLTFTTHVLDDYRSEACCVADFTGDGRLDIVAGPYLYEAPDWSRTKFRTLEGSVKKNGSGYLDDFGDIPIDVDGDGRIDVVSCGWFSKSIFWFRNEADASGMWPRHDVDKPGNFEMAQAADIDGDGGEDEVLPYMRKTIWYETKGPDAEQPGLVKHVISDEKMEFGGGVGDINDDGRPDVLRPNAWFEAPENIRKGEWEKHPWALGAKNGKATHTPEILTYDVDDDGLVDVVTSHAHGRGIYWYEQVKDGDERQWKQHLIDDSWSQPHSLALVDLDGDGDDDLVSGKRWKAHNGKDPGTDEPMVVYWYELQRDGNSASWGRHTITRGEGIGSGLNIAVADLDEDGDPDLVVTGKWGGPVWFENERE